MEPFSGNTLSILVLISAILAGIAFITVSFLIIYLLCMRYRRSNTISPTDTRSRTSSDSRTLSVSSISSSVSSVLSTTLPIPVKSPVIKSPKRKTQQQQQQQQPPPPPQIRKHHSDSITTIDEYSSDNQNRHQSVYKHNENNETIVQNENRIYNQRHRQRREQSAQPTTNVQFNDRHTPYPPDVLARERVMMNYLHIPKANGFIL
ncbi:unnamed protein product [Adineta steineri]|uniref:Uncharacterized protein n=1 Tax=Adineta steineri TaxID=433720 RepID=A0A819I874_9BILA|nr:unnamed protein product [Adineta steineri]CAF3914574.1 unnamed protein product [Adineta steineri]